MCGILAGVAVFVIIVLGFFAIFEVRIEENEQTEEKTDDGRTSTHSGLTIATNY